MENDDNLPIVTEDTHIVSACIVLGCIVLAGAILIGAILRSL